MTRIRFTDRLMSRLMSSCFELPADLSVESIITISLDRNAVAVGRLGREASARTEHRLAPESLQSRDMMSL